MTEGRRLVENLSGDLRSLSTEAKKKHNHVKEAAEAGLVKVRNISSGSTETNLLQNLRVASSELIHPLLMGCGTKNARLVQISLAAIQRLVQHRTLEPVTAPVIVNELWHLMEAECEELRVLQTLTLLVSTELLVMGQGLAKCLAMCFRLNFAKDPIVINTASASVRQMINLVFERVVQEDNLKAGDLPVVVHQAQNAKENSAPPTLRPCAADGFLLFRDLCKLINAEKPVWLVGIYEMTRTLGLELLESVLAGYPSIFIKHTEFAQLLKEQVCPLVIKLFSPNLKYIQISSQHPHSPNASTRGSSTETNAGANYSDRPYFPIAMRLLRVVVVLVTNLYTILVTECEIFLSLILKFLESDKLLWQRAMALEVLHRVFTQADLLVWFCENYDRRPNSTHVVQSSLGGLNNFIQSAFQKTEINSQPVVTKDEEAQEIAQAIGQPGFHYRGVWIPLHSNICSSKTLILDMLDKHDPPTQLSEGYCLSLAYSVVINCTRALYQIYEGGSQTMAIRENIDEDTLKQLFKSTHSSLLSALSLLLDASIDETINETLLKCLANLIRISCEETLTNKSPGNNATEATFYALCRVALPAAYLSRVVGIQPPPSIVFDTPKAISSKSSENFEADAAAGQPNQVVAVGTTCPTPVIPSSLLNSQVMLSAKNIQAARMLITCAQANGQQLTDCWHLVLATIQHLVWILGMRPVPTAGGAFRTGVDAQTTGIDTQSGTAQTASPTVLTTAVMADVAVMSSMLNHLCDSTVTLDDVGLHHVIAALCKLSSEAMMVSQNGVREPSFFAVAKLLQTGLANLERMEIYWKPITAHLIEVCGHSYPNLREWGAIALTSLIRSALITKAKNLDELKRQQMVLAPLSAMCDLEAVDVRRRQMDCLMQILQTEGQQLLPELWPTVIGVIQGIVNAENNFDDMLIKQAYQAVHLMVTDYLDTLPLPCVQMLVETAAKFGSQPCELNIALSALGQLWTISDFVRRKSANLSEAESETMWLVLYNCLSELCVDSRPPVRKSACQTLLQTVAAHGGALKNTTWKHMVWKVLFPMLDKVRASARNAPTVKAEDSSALGGANLLVHHSRDTASKQWAETSVQTLGGVVKIFNAQRGTLLLLDDFGGMWSSLLQYIEYSSTSINGEVSLAALKSFQELLLGKISAQTLDINTRERSTNSTSASTATNVINETEIPQLPENLWIVSWQAWIRIARALITPKTPPSPSELPPIRSPQRVTILPGTTPESNPPTQKIYIPGPSHLTAILHVFPALFSNVKKRIPVTDMQKDHIPGILKSIIAVPLSTEQAPFILPTSADITPTQDAVLDCVRIMYGEMVESQSNLRPALPDIFHLLLDFVLLAIRAPSSEWPGARRDSNMIPFAELSLRTIVEYYGSVAHYAEIVQATVLVDIVECLAQPMSLKYQCLSQSTWKTAASALITVLRLGLPIARQQARQFHALWPALVEALERFLFSTSKTSVQLNSDERKRHEFIDCQLIELIRSEILPFAISLPRDFIQRIIDLLNRGSIAAVDHSDVIALDSYQQRTELSRACFGALLSMSQMNTVGGNAMNSHGGNAMNSHGPDVIRSSSMDLIDQQPTSTQNLGSAAISSLLNRCKQVMTSFARDSVASGALRLAQERQSEMIAVHQAVCTLIDGLAARQSDAEVVRSEFYAQLVNLYPLVVDCVPCCKIDKQVEASVIKTLKAYQTLLLLKVHNLV